MDNSDDAPDDRRSSARTAARVEVHFGEGLEAARAFKAFSINVSAGGLCLKTSRPRQPGDRMNLALRIGEEPFELKGEVAWAKDGCVGVRFVEVSRDDQERLAKVVALLARPATSAKKRSSDPL